MKRNSTILALLLAAVVIAPPASAAVADLAESTPADAIAFVRVKGLHAAWKRFVNSPAWRRIEQAPIPDIADGIRKAREGIRQFELESGVNVEESLSAIFGTDILLALLPDKTALFLARTSDTAQLRLAVDTIVAIERDEGKIVSETNEYYAGVEIRSAVMADPNAPGAAEKKRHHAIVDDLLIVSRDFDAIRRAIDVVKGKSAALASSAEYRQAQKHLRGAALVQVYVDTDRVAQAQDWDALLDGRLQNPLVRILVRRAKQILPVTRYAVADLVAGAEHAEFRSTLIYDETRLPPSVKALLPAAGAPLDVMRLAPPSAVLAFGHQVNKAALWRYILESVRETHPGIADLIAARATQIGPMFGGMDFETELLAQIGDQTAVIVTPAPADAPPGVSVVIEMRNGLVIPMALRTMAGSAAVIARIEAQKAGTAPKVGMRRSTYKGVNLTTLELYEKELGGKLNPTMFVTDKFMVVSSTPETARTILNAGMRAPAEPLGNATVIGKGYLDVVGLREIVRQHKGFLVREGLKEGKTEDKARKDIEAIEFLLGFLDRVDARAEHVPGRITRTVRFGYSAGPPPAGLRGEMP